MKKQAPKEFSIQKKFPPDTLNNTTVKTLGNTQAPIEVFPPEIFFKDIESHQNYEVTVTVRNISKKVRRIKFSQPKTNKFKCDYDMQGPVAAGLAIKMNVSFETDVEGDFHDYIEINTEDHSETYKLYLHALKPAPDIQFEPLVNFKFIPINSTKYEEIEFKNEGRIAGTVRLEYDSKKNAELTLEPNRFNLEPDEVKRVRVGLTATDPDFLMKLIQVHVEGQDRVRNIEVTATSVEHHLSIVFEEGGGQKSALNFGTLYMGERREYPAFLVNNGPKPVEYYFKFDKGLHNIDDPQNSDDENIKSPSEMGKELTDRVLTAEPPSGIVAPYAQLPVKFICRTKKYEKVGGFSDHTMKAKPFKAGEIGQPPSEDKYSVKPEEYTSLARIKFNEGHDELRVQMMARACFPEVKISKQVIQFGECPQKERKDYVLTIKNYNEDLPIDFNFTKISHFHAVPARGKLLPGTEHSINISFEPNNFGVFNLQMDLELLGGIYKIPIKIMGSCNSMGQLSKGTRGPGAQPEDFNPERNFIDEYQADFPAVKTLRKTQTGGPNELPKWLQESTTLHIDSQLKIDNTEKIDQYLIIKQNKTKYNEFVKKERINREKEQRIAEKMKSTSRPPPTTFDEIKNDLDLGMDSMLQPPKLSLPTQVYPLVVKKAIGPYEPINDGGKSKEKRAYADENRIIKKKWKTEPTTQAELRDCSEELSGEQLQKINASPQLIDFKTVFVKSTTTKSFIVTNDLRQHIYVRLLIQDKELMQSTPLSQVIPPGQEAGFDIVFCSESTQSLTFRKEITYMINDRPFKFRVQAQAEPVSLDVSKKSLKFTFPDECMDMSISENIVITNTGNATAYFNWIYSNTGVFVPTPDRDEVPPGSSKIAKITFTPPGPKPDDEMLTLKITDGNPVDIKCTGIVNEARCVVKEKSVEFDNVPVGIRAKEQVFHIKNQIRIPAIFYVQCDNEELTVNPTRGKISADQQQIFNVSFLSNVEKEFNSEITVHIRGAKPLKVPVRANAIIPDVKVEEEIFDFSGVTFGDSKILPLTLHNDSNIDAKLVLDLRDYPEFEIILPQESIDDDVASEIMVPIAEQINYNDLDNMNPDDIKDPLNEDEMDEEEEEEDDQNKRHVQITLKPDKSPLKLLLKYTPCDVDDPRNFELPIKLAGVGEIEGLTRVIKGVGVKPRFLLEPTVINFKTKVIAKGSKPLPFHQDITISNPDHNPITWSVDRDTIDKSKVFQMNPTEGRLEPGTTSTVRVTFNPLEPLEYVVKVPLYLDGDKTKPYLMIEFRGEGAEAKIYFDRREVILPCVPLGFQSKATFLVCHNGYENLELRPKIATEVGKLPITLNFPDGKNLGVTKQKLKVEAVFQNKKPLSFTTHIDFYDDEGNKFSIPISGTTDNCLFTVFAFIQRNQDEITLEYGQGKPIMLIQDATSDQESGKTGMPGKAFSKTGASSVISRTARSLVGFNPVPVHILEKNCEYICRWFNATLSTSTMQNFPNDIINQNGNQVFELVAYLSGKRPPGQVPKTVGGGNNQNAKDTLKLLLTQYEELINFLKVNGAHLNTVRPEYLLSISDYSKFLKLNPKEENMKPKTLERIFPYLSMDSWMTVFYQILKIYYLNRVTGKSFKNLPGMPQAESNVDGPMQNSNLYSISETVLLKWMQYHYNKINPMHPKQITNFDADLHDGTVFAALIKSHYGNSRNIKEMKTSVYSEDQVIFNAKKVIEAVHEIGLQTHLSPSDIANPSARELLLFCIQLYQGLPHYIPKATIEFPAVLGDLVTKNIELNNPSKNPISYWVKLDGSPDFQIDDDSVRIEPSTTNNFPIKFQSRISNPVYGKIIFTNKKEGNIQAAAMVFELVSNVYERNSIEKIEKTTKLYKALQIDVELHNPFPQDVIFNIQIIYERQGKPGQGKKGAQAAGGAKGAVTAAVDKAPVGKKGQSASDLKPKNPNVPDPFSCKMENVRVRKNATVNVPVLFLPFELGVHKCFVVFTDENVGELQYTIIGKADLPEFTDNWQEQCNAEEPYIFRRQLNFKNDKLENAKNQVIDKATLQKQREAAAAAQNLAPDNKAKPGGAQAAAGDSKYFEIEISHPAFSGPSSIVLYDQARNFNRDVGNVKGGAGQVTTPKGGKHQQQSQGNEINLNMLELTVNPTKPATYPCFVILKSQDKTDIRLYEIKINAIPQKIKAQLEFRVPARGQVGQEIPIVNNSQKEWQVNAKLEQIKGGCFSLNRSQIVVKKGTTENFTLFFKPLWTCQVTGLLTLENRNTGEVYEYELKGFGEEPLAEDHIVLNCKARETTKHYFEIKNPTDKPVSYTVWTDLQNAVGKKEFTVKPKDVFRYELAITPLLGGVYTASVTFQDQEEKFMWWTVEVRTDSPKPEKDIQIREFIRKAKAAEIQLSNPLNEPITFEVFYSGEGLFGDSSVSIEPKSVGVYNLIFSPLQAGEFTGTVGFLNEKVGEYWYDLYLYADENPPVTLELLECELGKVASHFVQLENPTGQELLIDYRNSNPTNFEVIPDKIVLPPYEQQKICIQYSPSNLDVVETGSIVFENPQVGKWEYNIEGKGLLPTIMEPQPISTAVGNNTSSMLTFKNPFREASSVNVHIETDDTRIFSLLLKRNKFNIGPLGILQIPYSFSPQTMTESKATIVIGMSKQLVWRYPLRGIAESASTQIDYHFKTKARKPIEETLKIMLPGFEEVNYDDTFRYEINVQNPQHRGFIERSVFFEQKNETLQNSKDPLVFYMRFEPLRPFKTNTEFIVYKSTGGRWKFNIIFESVDPEVDDIIVIQSPLHKTSSVSFKLTNHMRTFAEFNAFFTPDSAPEFVVYPKTGLLEPYGKEGTNFIVSFTPTEYGKAKIGKLVIQTEEMQWTYEIRGSHPQYKIPEPGGGRIQNKLTKEVAQALKTNHQDKKNYIRENLKTTKYVERQGSPAKLTGAGVSNIAGGVSIANISQRGGNNKSRAGGLTTAGRDQSNDRSTFLKP